MAAIYLALVLLTSLGIRLLFIGVQLSNPGTLWSDYERCGPKYRIAQWLDLITLTCFVIPALIALYRFLELQRPLLTTFVGFLGMQLLSRLKAHRFPRTNVAGAFSEGKIDFIIHLALSVVASAGTTSLAGIYLWWRS